jgi:hypothetical protein
MTIEGAAREWAAPFHLQGRTTMSRLASADFWLNQIGQWDQEPSWSIIEPDKQAQAQTALGTYVVEVQPDNKSFRLRFASDAGERVCPTRFCCGRKPRVYRRPRHHLFCCRCDANFDPTTGKQIENSFYVKVEGGFVRCYDEDTDSLFDPVTQTYQPIKRGA